MWSDAGCDLLMVLPILALPILSIFNIHYILLVCFIIGFFATAIEQVLDVKWKPHESYLTKIIFGLEMALLILVVIWIWNGLVWIRDGYIVLADKWDDIEEAIDDFLTPFQRIVDGTLDWAGEYRLFKWWRKLLKAVPYLRIPLAMGNSIASRKAEFDRLKLVCKWLGWLNLLDWGYSRDREKRGVLVFPTILLNDLIFLCLGHHPRLAANCQLTVEVIIMGCKILSLTAVRKMARWDRDEYRRRIELIEDLTREERDIAMAHYNNRLEWRAADAHLMVVFEALELIGRHGFDVRFFRFLRDKLQDFGLLRVRATRVVRSTRTKTRSAPSL